MSKTNAKMEFAAEVFSNLLTPALERGEFDQKTMMALGVYVALTWAADGDMSDAPPVTAGIFKLLEQAEEVYMRRANKN